MSIFSIRSWLLFFLLLMMAIDWSSSLKSAR